MSISPPPSPPKRRLRTTFAVGGAALLAGLVLALGPSVAQGSTSDSSTDVVGGSSLSVSVPKPPTITTGKVTGTDAERTAQADAFTACMRENGVPNFPGVTVNADGTLQLVGGTDVDPVSESYQAAAKSCASTLPSSSALPVEPSVPTLSVPAPLNIDCSGTACPAEPAAPKAPVLPN